MDKEEVNLEGTGSLREDGIPPNPEAFLKGSWKKLGHGELSEGVHLADPCMSCPGASSFRPYPCEDFPGRTAHLGEEKQQSSLPS